MVRTRHTGIMRGKFLDNSSWSCFNGHMNKQTRDSTRGPHYFYFFNLLPHIPGGCVFSKRGYVASPRRILTVTYYSQCTGTELFIIYVIFHVGWRVSGVNAHFRARITTAQSGFHHGTGGWRALPEHCGILALGAVKMALVKYSAIELISSKDSSERWMDAQNLKRTALARIQCGACSRGGLGVEIWMMTGKWLFPWRSLRTVLSRCGAIDRLQSQVCGGGRTCSHADVLDLQCLKEREY